MSRTEELRDRILNPFITNVARAALLRQYACTTYPRMICQNWNKAHNTMVLYEKVAQELEEDMWCYPPEYGSLYVTRISGDEEWFLAFK
ncbi:MAG: hypothetical protein P8Y00_00345 [Deltaproteobacteria bacterium]